MKKPLFLLQAIIAIVAVVMAAGVAGCTVSQASDRDQYGNYLAELSSGNTEFSQGSNVYKAAMNAFDGEMYNDAISGMSSASGYYSLASKHYGQMDSYAATQDQKAYAEALGSYADSCRYASIDYMNAYKAYESDDRQKGAALMNEASTYIAQANEYHDKAVKLQPMAVN